VWENIVGALRDGLSLVVTFVPKLLLFLVILLIGWLGQATANLKAKAQTATGAAPQATDGSVSGNAVGAHRV
jgi:hypothetical protein